MVVNVAIRTGCQPNDTNYYTTENGICIILINKIWVQLHIFPNSYKLISACVEVQVHKYTNCKIQFLIQMSSNNKKLQKTCISTQ